MFRNYEDMLAFYREEMPRLHGGNAENHCTEKTAGKIFL